MWSYLAVSSCYFVQYSRCQRSCPGCTGFLWGLWPHAYNHNNTFLETKCQLKVSASARSWTGRGFRMKLFHMTNAGWEAVYTTACCKLMKSKYRLVRMQSTFIGGTPSSHGINDSAVSLPAAAWVTPAPCSEHCPWRNTPTGLWFWHQKHTERVVHAKVKVLTQGGVKKHASDIQIICPHFWAPPASAARGPRRWNALLFSLLLYIDYCFVVNTETNKDNSTLTVNYCY